MTGYCTVVRNPLKTNATDDILADMDAETLCFRRASNMMLTKYVEPSHNKAQRIYSAYDEYVFKEYSASVSTDRFDTESVHNGAGREMRQSVTPHVSCRL